MRDPFGWPRGPFPVRLGAPAIDLNFLTGTMPAGLSFTRASTATYIGSDGLLKTAAVDEPRFDYDPVTLACKGLLIEGARTNLLTRSNDFTNAVWSKQRMSVTPAAAVGSDGAWSMTKMVENAENNSHYIVQSQNYTAGQFYTASVEAKAGERSVLQIVLQSVAFGTNFVGFYNLQNGECFARSGSSAKMENLGNGIYRCHLTAQASATATDGVQIRMHTDYIDTLSGYQGDGASGLYLGFAQLEVGTFPSSYIPTTTAAVTRAADVCLMTGADFSRWFNPLEGTIVAEFGLITNGLNSTGGNAFPHVYDIDQTVVPTSGHSLLASAGYGPGVRAQTKSAGVSQAELTHAVSLGTGAVMRHAYAYKTNDFAACLNGGAVLTDALGILISPDRLAIGSMDAGGSNQLDGHIRRIRDWPRRLSNARLQELTA